MPPLHKLCFKYSLTRSQNLFLHLSRHFWQFALHFFQHKLTVLDCSSNLLFLIIIVYVVSIKIHSFGRVNNISLLYIEIHAFTVQRPKWINKCQKNTILHEFYLAYLANINMHWIRVTENTMLDSAQVKIRLIWIKPQRGGIRAKCVNFCSFYRFTHPEIKQRFINNCRENVLVINTTSIRIKLLYNWFVQVCYLITDCCIFDETYYFYVLIFEFWLWNEQIFSHCVSLRFCSVYYVGKKKLQHSWTKLTRTYCKSEMNTADCYLVNVGQSLKFSLLALLRLNQVSILYNNIWQQLYGLIWLDCVLNATDLKYSMSDLTVLHYITGVH